MHYRSIHTRKKRFCWSIQKFGYRKCWK